ncbi:competence type IV pilus assembly protein ComGB [Ureibacillus sp. FSL K6-2830]|uniref:competence type IV pilus assembly protein ComGB n=1 Tax=Ureibacillus sp. FSL K6-2830 TaxID=2954610 RepID=UPI0030FC7554
MLQQISEKMIFPIQRNYKEKVRDVPSLLNRTSILLKEGYTFSDALFMLLPYHVKELEKWNALLQQQFNNGSSAVDILQQLSIPKHFLLLIAIAEEKGDLAESLHHVSKQIKFQEDTQRKIMKLLMYPAFLMILLTMVFILFRSYFLPNIEQLVISNHSEKVNSINFAVVLLHIPDFLILLFIISLFLIFISIHSIRKKEIAHQLNIIMKIPIVKYVYQVNLTRQFSHLLGSLLVSGISLQQALSILEQQQISRHLSYITALLKQRVKFGDSLSEAVKILQLFMPKFDELIQHGEKNGYLGREMLIFSELLNERIQSTIKFCLASIQPLFFILIAICIVAAYLSILLPMYDLVEIM